MNWLWIVIIALILAIVFFVLLPNVLKNETVTPAVPVHVVVALEAEKEQAEARRMLDSHYENARASVPEDYPAVPIGACPYSKPMSTNLPQVDVPMCMLKST